MEQMDKNKDQKLSIEELKSSIQDEDDEDEMPPEFHEKLASFFKDADTDGDGHLNVEELPGLISRFEKDEEL